MNIPRDVIDRLAEALAEVIAAAVSAAHERARANMPGHAPPPSGPSRVMRTRAAAKYVGLSESTLEKMRLAGGGPRFTKLGTRAVGYDTRDLDAWLGMNGRASTSSQAELMTIDALAERFGVSPWTIRTWIRLGRVPSVKLGRRVLVPVDAADALVKENLRPTRHE